MSTRLTTLSHTSEGHRVSVHYGYDDKGRLTGERQTVENPETGELLWHHETGHAYNEQGLANRVTPDSLPPVEWLTYGSGYLAGMKLGGTPLLEFTRDRLHRETVRTGACRWRSSAKTAIRRGAGSMMNGATSLMRRTRITCTSRTVCQGSSMMRSRGCTITVTGTTIRCRGGISPRTRLG